jgi:tetratricopeptide (TPR) repeat protein
VGAEWDYTFAERLIVAGRAVWFYIAKLFAPIDLAFIYEKWAIDAARIVQWTGLVAAVAVLAMLAMTTKRLGRGTLAALLLYGGTILPALGFFNYFPMRYSFVANHFAYLAAIPLIVLVCAGAARLLRDKSREIGVGIGAVVCVGLGVLSFLHARIYEGPERIWRDTIARSPGAWMAHNNLAQLMLAQGKLEQAAQGFDHVLKLRKNHVEAHMNLGSIAEQSGRAAEAEQMYRVAIDHALAAEKLDSQITGKPVKRRNHAIPMMRLGAMKVRSGDLAAAADLYQMALSRNRSVEVLQSLGEIERLRGNYHKAIELQNEAAQLAPESPQTRLNLAKALVGVGQFDEAMLLAAAVMTEHGNADPAAAEVIGLIYAAQGQWSDAAKMFEHQLRLDPDAANAQRNLETARRRAATQPSTRPATKPI